MSNVFFQKFSRMLNIFVSFIQPCGSPDRPCYQRNQITTTLACFFILLFLLPAPKYSEVVGRVLTRIRLLLRVRRFVFILELNVMRFVKQTNGIEHFVLEQEGNSKKKRHGPLLPNNNRRLLVGPSGCGKTSAILSLLLSPRGLRFKN